jgi:hypothetical protein
MTSLGLLMMNKGDAMAGNGKLAKTGGSLDMKSPENDRSIVWGQTH